MVQQQIHDRIHSDYPQFEEQLETSISIQQRLETLKQNVEELGNSITNPEVWLSSNEDVFTNTNADGACSDVDERVEEAFSISQSRS